MRVAGPDSNGRCDQQDRIVVDAILPSFVGDRFVAGLTISFGSPSVLLDGNAAQPLDPDRAGVPFGSDP